MSQSNNVLDLTSRLKNLQKNAQSKEKHSAAFEPVVEPKVIDMSEKRSNTLSEERRRVRRTILSEFISVHTIVPGMGLMKVALFDINQKGLSFDLDMNMGRFQVGEELAMRIYLNFQTYLPFSIKIKHTTEVAEEGVYRHGAEISADTLNQKALEHFIGFLENVSAGLKYDGGDVIVSNMFPKA